ncbi:MAG TPA: HypC/HybG/HupF family hydrogenase formation chaperone [Acidimicrobiia bacterium]|jgi:hydrogenase expression/formation protein HypC
MCLPRIGCIVEVDGLEAVITDAADSPHRVSLLCVPTAVAGDFVMVHAGYAIRVMDATEAAERRALIDAVTRDPEPARTGLSPLPDAVPRIDDDRTTTRDHPLM